MAINTARTSLRGEKRRILYVKTQQNTKADHIVSVKQLVYLRKLEDVSMWVCRSLPFFREDI